MNPEQPKPDPSRVQRLREEFKKQYENPRGLPEAWLDNYLNRNPAQLAIDVIRANDANFQLARENSKLKLLVWLLSLVVSPFLAEVVKLIFHAAFK